MPVTTVKGTAAIAFNDKRKNKTRKKTSNTKHAHLRKQS